MFYCEINQPISIEQYAAKSRLSELKVNQKYVFWLDVDLNNKSRQYINAYSIHTKKIIKLTSSKLYHVKTAINEYGGGSYWLNDEYLFFYNKDDCSVYQVELANITDNIIINKIASSAPELENLIYNYADGFVIGDNFICVREIRDDKHQVYQQLVSYNSKTKLISILDQEHDFYCFPRLNQDNSKLIWISRQHPNMPWDYNCLYSADFDGNVLSNKKELLNIKDNSLYQPEWIDNTNILIVSEHNHENPYWNIYNFCLCSHKLSPLAEGKYETGLPLWQLGSNTYCIDKLDKDMYFYSIYNGSYAIHQIDNASNKITQLESPAVFIQDNMYFNKGNLYYLATTLYSDLALYKHAIRNNEITCLYPDDLLVYKNASKAEEIKFTNSLDQESYAYFYKPNLNFYNDKKPPLIVMCHSGPTGTNNIGYNSKIQFWTSRGYAVVDVNYGGSTSLGRDYRERLKHNWGIVDVADCAAAAEYLILHEFVDKHKVIIRGSSAGGFTVLTALYKYNVFTAGICLYAVSDLLAFGEDTHNFEKHYNDYLIGDYQQNDDEYLNRSPINFADKVSKPVLIIHGGQDTVVPVDQSRDLYKKLKNNNSLNQYIEIENEGHGFRTKDGLCLALESELNFLSNL